VSERDVIELNQLVYRYAAAVDACDVAAFIAVFSPDARFRVYQTDAETPSIDLTGHAQLASIPDTMRKMYRRTAHMMTNPLVDIDGDRATGTVLCTARHLGSDPRDQRVLTVMIRYVDCYVKQDGAWRISDRQIRFLWIERHEVVDHVF
jgi:ketosteroid isomerase-like protein